MKNTLCLPHMGASTTEATDNCAVMAVDQVKDYILNGNIKNSVNFPEIDMGETSGSRLCVLYEGAEDYSGRIEKVLLDNNVEIRRLISSASNGWGAMLADLSRIEDDTIQKIMHMEFVRKVRII
jgi:D-3-phosphoglycerate dehydrogenase